MIEIRTPVDHILELKEQVAEIDEVVKEINEKLLDLMAVVAAIQLSCDKNIDS